MRIWLFYYFSWWTVPTWVLEDELFYIDMGLDIAF